MNEPLKVGDVVFLNSNPKLSMTVDFVLGESPANKLESFFAQQMRIAGYEDGDVNCTWFEEKTLRKAPFKAKMLTLK